MSVRDIQTTFTLEYKLVELNPNIKFKPKHMMLVHGRTYTDGAISFWLDTLRWWIDCGLPREHWHIDRNGRRVWCKDLNTLLLYKLAFNGYTR